MSRKIKVKSAFQTDDKGGHPVACFDRNDAHKDGELYIADDKVHNVAFTPGVAKAIADGRLIDVEHAVDPIDLEDAVEGSGDEDEGDGEGDEDDSSGAPDNDDDDDVDDEAVKRLVRENNHDALLAMAKELGVELGNESDGSWTKKDLAKAIVAKA